MGLFSKKQKDAKDMTKEEHMELFSNLAVDALKNKDSENALKYAKVVYGNDENPQNQARNTYVLASAHYFAEEYVEARLGFLQILELYPKSGFALDALYRLALVSMKVGSYDVALKALDKYKQVPDVVINDEFNMLYKKCQEKLKLASENKKMEER